MIGKCVDDIWHWYDETEAGFIEKDEAKGFVEEILADMHEQVNEAKICNDNDFEHYFRRFDERSSGTLEKGRAVQFIK